MRLILSIALLSISFTGLNQIQWIYSNGGSSTDQEPRITSYANDIIVAGMFMSNVDLDPGTAIDDHTTNNGSKDIYVQKIDDQGNLIWALSFGGWGSEVLADVEVDHHGNIYLLGYYTGTTDFDPGPNMVNKFPNSDGTGFILKLTNNGDFVWVQTFGLGGQVYPTAMDISEDHIVTVGHYNNDPYIDPGNTQFQAMGVSNLDSYIQKLDLNGQFIWAQTLTDQILFRDLSIAPNDEIYVTGAFLGTVDFDYGPGVAELTAANAISNVFVWKIDTDGFYIWAKHMSGEGNDDAYRIKVHSENEIYLCGRYNESINLSMTLDTTAIYSNLGLFDAFVTKFDRNGEHIWNYVWGHENGHEYAKSMDVDVNGNVWLGGTYSGSFDIDNGPDSTILSSSGPYNVFYLALNGFDGSYEYATRIAGICNSSEVTDIHISANNDVYSVGEFEGYIDFDPEHNQSPINAMGDIDTYVLKFGHAVELNQLEELDFKLFPNPTQNSLIISSSLNITKIRIINFYGAFIEVPVNGDKIDVSALPAGNYFIGVVFEDGTIQTQTFIKL